jgi:cell division septal protein FtsQ
MAYPKSGSEAATPRPGRSRAALLVKIVLVLLIVSAGAFFLLHSAFFNIKEVTVRGNQYVEAEIITQLARVPLETNIFLADMNYIALAAEAHPLIKQVQAVRNLPGTIELIVLEREAWANIPAADGLLVVDRDSVYLDKIDYIMDATHPLITLSELPPLVIGQPVNPEAFAAIETLYDQLEPEIAGQLSEFHYDAANKFLTLYTLQGTEIRFGTVEERLADKLPMVARALSLERELNAEGKEALAYVDIRYSGAPVIQTR